VIIIEVEVMTVSQSATTNVGRTRGRSHTSHGAKRRRAEVSCPHHWGGVISVYAKVGDMSNALGLAVRAFNGILRHDGRTLIRKDVIEANSDSYSVTWCEYVDEGDLDVAEEVLDDIIPTSRPAMRVCPECESTVEEDGECPVCHDNPYTVIDAHPENDAEPADP